MASEKRELDSHSSIGILAVTQNGARLALQLQQRLPGSVCYVPERHRFALAMGAVGFQRLGAALPKAWAEHDALVCIMATGIVVRQIAGLIRHKTVDPAVVVLDEKGQFVISLLSGHLGGANRLAHRIARMIEGQAVITTASDVQEKPAIDLIAREIGLDIENPEMIARLTRAFLENETVGVFDPYDLLSFSLKDEENLVWLGGAPVGEGEPRMAAWSSSGERIANPAGQGKAPISDSGILPPQRSQMPYPCIWACDLEPPADMRCLLLRPRNLVVGVGCNRGTSTREVMDLLQDVFSSEKLSFLSIRNLASIDLKADEPAILEAARALGRPVHFYARADLKDVSVPNPSSLVKTHVGVPSVCEAAALMSVQKGSLIVSKRKTANATLAVARVDYPL